MRKIILLLLSSNYASLTEDDFQQKLEIYKNMTGISDAELIKISSGPKNSIDILILIDV